MQALEIETFIRKRRTPKVRWDDRGHSVWIGRIGRVDEDMNGLSLSVAEPDESWDPYDRVGRQLKKQSKRSRW